MAEMLDAGSSDEVKLWLQQVHVALEKQPARELFAKFNRDTTVCIACMLMPATSCDSKLHWFRVTKAIAAPRRCRL